MNYKAIGNDELGEVIKGKAKCPKCGQMHDIEYGERINADGSRTPSKTVGFVRCDEMYLVSINGRRVL